MFRRGAIGVVDQVGGGGAVAVRLLDNQDLITADPKPAVGQQPQLSRSQIKPAGAGVDYHEIVAQPMHLYER
jgi:hypothetical protein